MGVRDCVTYNLLKKQDDCEGAVYVYDVALPNPQALSRACPGLAICAPVQVITIAGPGRPLVLLVEDSKCLHLHPHHFVRTLRICISQREECLRSVAQ